MYDSYFDIKIAQYKKHTFLYPISTTISAANTISSITTIKPTNSLPLSPLSLSVFL